MPNIEFLGMANFWPLTNVKASFGNCFNLSLCAVEKSKWLHDKSVFLRRRSYRFKLLGGVVGGGVSTVRLVATPSVVVLAERDGTLVSYVHHSLHRIHRYLEQYYNPPIHRFMRLPLTQVWRDSVLKAGGSNIPALRFNPGLLQRTLESVP